MYDVSGSRRSLDTIGNAFMARVMHLDLARARRSCPSLIITRARGSGHLSLLVVPISAMSRGIQRQGTISHVPCRMVCCVGPQGRGHHERVPHGANARDLRARLLAVA